MNALAQMTLAGLLAWTVLIGALAVAVLSWRRRARRQARARVERELDHLAARIAEGLAAGAEPHRLVARYGRASAEAETGRTARDHAMTAARLRLLAHSDRAWAAVAEAVSRRATPATTGTRTPGARSTRAPARR